MYKVKKCSFVIKKNKNDTKNKIYNVSTQASPIIVIVHIALI